MEDDYREALKLGEVLVAYARVVMIGPGGVGKSSFLRGLMNQELLQNAESTMLADTKTLKPHFWAKTGQAEDSYWEEVTNQDEIGELAGLIRLVALAKSGSTNPSHAAKILSSITASAAVSIFYPLGFKPHKVPTIHQEFVSSIKDTVVHDTLMQALESTNSSLESLATPQSTEVLIHVWDCGGQHVFLDVLPAFLTSRTMFLLFFDARQNLLNKCKMLCHKQGRIVSTTEGDFTVLQLLMQWMACIHTTLTSQKAMSSSNPDSQSSPSNPPTHTENSTRQSTKEGIIPKFPRIIPVGTHGDDALVKKKKKEILDTLRSHCEDKAFTHLLLDGVIVDNTLAGKQAEDSGFKYIRRKVHNFATDDLAIPTPVAWVLFRKVLQKVAESEHCSIVSYQQAVAVGEVCGISEGVVPSVLRFYHELAVFLHYAQIDSLSQFIITDPQWLIKQLGKLLAPEKFRLHVSNPAVWKPLRESGLLVQPLYEEVWKGSNTSPQSLADLLEHFHLAAFIGDNFQNKVTVFPGREYFVPSVLQLSSQTADSTTKFVKKSSPLHLTFSTQYVPPGFFTRLATTLSKESNCHLLFQRGVFRNKMTFSYGNDDRIDEFTIFEHSSSVQITVVRNEYRQPHVPTFASVCRSIMELMQERSASVCQWLPSVKVEAALCCERCSDKNHFILIPPGTKTSSVLLCQAAFSCRFTNDQQNWLMIPNTPETLAHKGDFSDAELQGVADAIQRDEKLKELADALEVVPLLESIEGEANAPFTLLRRWRLGVDSDLEAHSLLVYHLRCIGFTRTAHRLQFREFLSLSDPSSRTRPSACPSEEKKEPLLLSHIIACCRYIDTDGDLTLLAAALDIHDEEVATIKSKFKLASGQALQMLKKWQSSGTHSRQELIEILQAAGFSQAAQNLCSPEYTSTTKQELHLRDLVTHVRTTEWHRLGLQLDLDDYCLQQIHIDARDSQERLTMVFQTWLKLCKNPSWVDIVKALEGIGENYLGAKLEQKFCN